MESMVLYKARAQCGKVLVNIGSRFQKSRLTRRAPDLGYAPRFQAFFVALADSRFAGESILPPQAGNAHR
jgi:hypothetical protein